MTERSDKDGGFLILARALFRHPLWLRFEPDRRCVMLSCIYLANWRDSRMWLKDEKREILVPRGSFIAAQDNIAKEANVGRQIVRTTLRILQRNGFLTRTRVSEKANRRMTLVTICNYDEYQSLERWLNQRNSPPSPNGSVLDPSWIRLGSVLGQDGGETPQQKGVSNQDLTTVQPTPNHEPTPLENIEDSKVTSGKSATRARKARTPLPSSHWSFPLVANYHQAQCSEVVDLHTEAEELDKLHRIDKHAVEEIAAILAWIPTDVVDPPRGDWRGWSDVVDSLAGLRRRRRKGEHTKFEKIKMAWKKVQRKAAPEKEHPRCPICDYMRLYPQLPCEKCKAPPLVEGNLCPRCENVRADPTAPCGICGDPPIEQENET